MTQASICGIFCLDLVLLLVRQITRNGEKVSGKRCSAIDWYENILDVFRHINAKMQKTEMLENGEICICHLEFGGIL
jgi:hypothetical protein